MKKFFAILIAMLLLLTGCGPALVGEKEEVNGDNTAQNSEEDIQEEPVVEEKPESNKALEKNLAYYLNDNLFLVEEEGSSTLQLVSLTTGLEDLTPGQIIKFTYDGGIKESFPAQATAKDIEVTGSFITGLKTDLITGEAIKEFGGDKISILDVRTYEEYVEGHIKNSENMPLDTLEFDIGHKHDKDQILILYCRSGNRSEQAQAILEQQGYFAIDAGGINTYEGELVK